MGIILKSNGTKVESGKLSVKKLQTVIGGWIQICHTIDGRVMVVNEDGKLRNLPYNSEATKLYIYGEVEQIVGDVVICEIDEINRI